MLTSGELAVHNAIRRLIDFDRTRAGYKRFIELVLSASLSFVGSVAPIGFGLGSGDVAAQVLGSVPSGGGPEGKFGPVVKWPLIPIHASLLPDGRILTYGTNLDGTQGSRVYYDIWDPKLGTVDASHKVLTKTTNEDIFCNTGTLIGASANGNNRLTGKFLGLGGDLTIDGIRNYSNNDIVVFDPATNDLTAVGTMRYPRWYASLTTLPTGDKLLLGGRRTITEIQGLGPPAELFSATRGWRSLPNIRLDPPPPPDSIPQEWYYPRAAVGGDGAIYLLSQLGKIYRMTTAGAGTITDTGARLNFGEFFYPTVLLPNVNPHASSFKVLAVRENKVAQVVDLATNPPTVTSVGSLHYDRVWGNLTILADGKVLATGGSASREVSYALDHAGEGSVVAPAYRSEIFDPGTGQWTETATAARLRVYHSTNLLLPDGAVLTGGGGAPGPVYNLDAQIYYPPYLYDAAGNPRPRPTLVDAPTILRNGKPFTLSVGSTDTIGRVHLLRVGYFTHSYDPEQRLIPLPFTQTGTKITGTVTLDAKILPPGYYMLFVLNQAGTPSIAKIVSVPQYLQ